MREPATLRYDTGYMVPFNILRSPLVAACLAAVSMCQMSIQVKSPHATGQNTPEETLQNYLRLRLSNADWKEYSKLVTWRDEPGWDCNWVVDKYSVGLPRRRAKNTVLPVAYNRLVYSVMTSSSRRSPKKSPLIMNLSVVRPAGR